MTLADSLALVLNAKLKSISIHIQIFAVTPLNGG